jgi:hypothetical protein
MNIAFRTTDGKELDANLNMIVPDGQVRIGEYEMSLEQFAGMASHILIGGLFGWPGHVTPEPVNKALTFLFDMYRQEGKWTRRKKNKQSLT